MTTTDLDEWLDGSQICDDCRAELLTLRKPTLPFKAINSTTGECATCRARL